MRRSPLRILSRFSWFVSVTWAVVFLAGSSAFALHQESPGAIRITKAGSHEGSTGRSWGNYTAFVSSADLAFTGNQSQQAFVFKLFPWACQNGDPTPTNLALCANPPEPVYEQATSGPGAPTGPSIGLPSGTCELNSQRACQSNGDCKTGGDDFGVCEITAQWMAFEADGSFNGGAGAGVGHRQVILKNLRTDEVVRVTDSGAGESTRPSLNELGNIIVFQSTAPLTGTPTGGVPQLFVYERRTNLLRQITFGAGPSINAVPNRTGNLIVFQSRADLLGDGSDTGVWQIYVADYDKTLHSATLTQLTNGDADSMNPWISETEKWVSFESSASNLGGVPGSNQIYLANLQPTIPEIRQITDQATYGDCHMPVVDLRATRIVFVCNGDPLQNGTVGSRLFTFDTQVDPLDPTDAAQLRQITGAGDVIGRPAHNLGLWFTTVATTSDLDGQGSCGAQLWAVNYFDDELGHWRGAQEIGELPPDVATPGPGNPVTNFIGRRTLFLQKGDGVVGTSATLTTNAGSTTHPLSDDGAVTMVIGAPDEFSGISSISVLAGQSSFPPIPLPGVGAICLTPSEDGTGMISCLGGAPGGDLTVIQDHNTDDSDPSCVFGCREGDVSCQGELPGPHVFPCPVCVGGFCGLGSTNAGASCTTSAECVPSQQCLGGFYGVCNGQTITSPGGAFVAGGMRLTMPLWIDISQGAGLDGLFCTTDDNYGAEGVTTEMNFTTGVMQGVVLDADNVGGTSLLSSDTGAPFNCVSLDAGVMFGAALQGTMPVLDIPNVPQLRDMLVRLRVEPRIEPGVCDATCGSDTDCDDANPCNGAEFCVNGVCLMGSPIVCDDGDVCNGAETCDVGTGACLPGLPCNDGDACNGVETCDQVNGCQVGTPVVCTDGDVCNGDETCDPLTGSCLAGVAPVCDDGNPCTDDGCDSATGCFVLPNTDPCDDGTLCTTGDTCTGGACVGTPVACDDGDACNGVETCDAVLGCQAGSPPVCDDGNPCTDDACDSATGCFVLPNSDPCDDGDACTTADICAGGTCVGAPVVCDDGDACNGVETCDGVLGCLPGSPLVCDDGNGCTDDGCDSATGCFVLPNTDPCDDGDLCTSGDVCGGGTCAGAPVVCDDGDVCNGVESCDPGTGGCLTGISLVCDDGNLCTDDVCDPVLGCQNVNNTAPCDDGNACTAPDTCSGGVCVGAGDVMCTLSALEAAILDATPEELGNARRQRRLLRMALKARTRAEAAIFGNPLRASKNLKRSARALEKIVIRVEKWIRRGKVDPDVGQEIVDLAADALAQIQQALVSP